MSIEFFMDRMVGKWVSQSTYYTSSSNRNSRNIFSKTLINQVKWSNVNNNKTIINSIKKQVNKEKIKNHIRLYKIESNNNHTFISYIAFFKNQENNLCLVKFNQALQQVNSFIFVKVSNSHLCLISQVYDITILEKIYFLNTNVKLVKSITKKSNKCILTSFSSEIKIS